MCFASSRHGTGFQALAKPRFRPIRSEVGACPLQWQSWPWDGSQRADSCNRSTENFAFFQSPWEHYWTRPGKFDAMDLFREAASHIMQASTACIWTGSAMPSSSLGTSSVGKRRQCMKLGTAGVSHLKQKKATVNDLELETLGCRIDGNAGVIAPPRSVVSRLIGLTAWFARNPSQRRQTAEILGGSWVRCFQFRKEVSSLFIHYREWLHSQAAVSRGKTITVPREVLQDLLPALCHLPLILFNLRLRTSPLVVASDASSTGFGVCRTSSLDKIHPGRVTN